MSADQSFSAYPMGPNVQRYLGLAASPLGESSPAPTPEEQRAFAAFLLNYAENHPVTEAKLLIDLIEELVAMDLPEIALKLVDYHPDAIPTDDFRAAFLIGNAAMMTGDLSRAESCLRDAQELAPEEPAPYANLAQIFLHEERPDEALAWIKAGLDADRDHVVLWELLYSVYAASFGEKAPLELKALAEKLQSWAGLSLVAELTAPTDPRAKSDYLESLYHQGKRDAEFLVELTAALGMAGDYEKIPAIVWAAEKQANGALPWQLLVHGAQAFLAMEDRAQCLAQLAKAEKDQALPARAREAIAQLAAEAREVATH